MDDLIVASEIPDGHPRKQAIEGALQDSFRPIAGTWRVAIRRAQPWANCWGFVIVDGPNRFHRLLPVDGPDDIQARVNEEFARSITA